MFSWLQTLSNLKVFTVELVGCRFTPADFDSMRGAILTAPTDGESLLDHAELALTAPAAPYLKFVCGHQPALACTIL